MSLKKLADALSKLAEASQTMTDYAREHDEMINKSTDTYKEIFRLEQMLLSANIPYRLREFWNGFQIGYPEVPEPYAYKSKCVCSVIEHYGSYGSEDDLLEIRGLTQNDDEVEGWLSAEEVFNRISSHYNSCVLKQ